MYKKRYEIDVDSDQMETFLKEFREVYPNAPEVSSIPTLNGPVIIISTDPTMETSMKIKYPYAKIIDQSY